MVYDNVVIGSSISALGCITGLVESSKKVLCIDGSDNIAEEKRTKNDDVVFGIDKMPIKKTTTTGKFENKLIGLNLLESKSHGGLSNIWGAKCLRLLDQQFEGWPISYNELKKYYVKCEKIMNVSHFEDELSDELDIDNSLINNRKLDLYSSFSKNFLNKKKTPNNFVAGFSRIAIDPKCYKCGYCFFGCPDNYVFNTKDCLNELIKKNKIQYIKNLILKKFVLKDGLIELEFENSKNEKILTKKLFIGAGPTQTPKIVMNSVNQENDLNLLESQNLFVPCFYIGKNFNSNLEHQTLGDVVIISKKAAKYNLGNIYYALKYDPKLMNKFLKKKFGIFYNLIPNFIIKRLFVISVLINSSYSTYSAKINKNKLNYKIIENKNNKIKITREISNHLKILGKNYNFISSVFFSVFSDFGRSFHLGSSIPMLDEQKNQQIQNYNLYTKKNGEVSKFKNVFIIDSSNFPNIPAGDISLTIMANALRIAEESLND